VPSVGSTDTSGIAAAAAAARAAPLVVLAIGSNRELETEGHDRTLINISDAQLALVAAVADAATGPVVALVLSGGAMDVSPLLANAKIGAVLVCGQPSVQIVGAGDIIFGKTLDGRPVAPAARMSQTTCAQGGARRARHGRAASNPPSPQCQTPPTMWTTCQCSTSACAPGRRRGRRARTRAARTASTRARPCCPLASG
jgi:hypothetical protein